MTDALRPNLWKDIRFLRRDWRGLLVAIAVPAVVIALYASIRLDSGIAPAQLPDPESLVLCLAIWLAGFGLSLESIAGERVLGTIVRMRTTASSDSFVAVSKWLVLGLLVGLQAILLWICALVLLDLRLEAAGMVNGAAILFALGLTAVSLGLLVSALSGSAGQRGMHLALLTLVSITLSGFITPLNQIGAWRVLADWLPFTLAYQQLRIVLAAGQVNVAETGLVFLESVLFLSLAELAARKSKTQ